MGLNRNLSPLYLNSTLRNLALSLVGIFVPLYILKLTGNIFAVLGYFLLLRLSEILFMLPGANLTYKLHFRGAVLFSSLLLSLKLGILILAERNPPFLIPASILTAFYLPFYWLPYHLIFIEDGRRKRFGKQLGTMGIISRLTGALGPLFGGLIIAFLGFRALYTLTIFVVLASSVPLFFTPHHKDYGLPSWSNVLKGFSGADFKKTFLAFFGVGTESISQGILWPIFVFLAVSSYEVLGILASVSLLLSLFTLRMVGRIVDKKGEGEVLHWGTTATGAIWLFKGFASSVGQIFAVDSLYRCAQTFLGIPFDALVYKKALREHPFEFMLKREFALNLGRVFSLSFVAVMLFWGANFPAIFLLAVVGSWLAGLMSS